jgi:N,N'-diacetyllegionaminate synthase
MYSYIVAEIGVNHNGSLDQAKRLIEKALIAGADCAKFQTFWGLTGLEKYEFTKDQWEYLKGYCDEMGIDFMTTPHTGSPICGYYTDNFEVIDFIDPLVKIHKIASPYIVKENYMRHIASKGKPVFMSTGSITNYNKMATDAEITRALEWLKGIDVILLHCVSAYPPDDGMYDRIKELKKFGKPVGISDHTQKKSFPPLPVIEKHFKLDDNCIDAGVSLKPEDFDIMVQCVRNFEKTYARF